MVRVVIDEKDLDTTFIDEVDRKFSHAIVTAMEKVGGEVAGNIRTNFAAQGRRGGNPRWRRNSFRLMELNKDFPYKGNVAAQVSYAENKKALISTGKLRDSIEVLDTGYKEGSWVLSIGTEVDYALLMEKGGKGVRAVSAHTGAVLVFDVPPRPFMYLTKQDGDLFAKAVAEEIRDI